MWLTQEEEQGYYYGFANEGLWPLCHIAHTRPIFRAPDWEHYRDASTSASPTPCVDEASTERPDRARAGLPLRAAAAHDPRAPAARDRSSPSGTSLAESRGVRHLPVARGDARRHARLVDPRLPHAVPLQQLLRHGRPLPRGARRPRDLQRSRTAATRPRCAATRSRSSGRRRRSPVQPAGRGLPQAGARARSASRADVRIGVGVDRLDYTKGILERLHGGRAAARAASRAGSGRFSFVQVAAPARRRSRSTSNLDAKVRALAERINERFGRPRLRADRAARSSTTTRPHVYELYRAADALLRLAACTTA